MATEVLPLTLPGITRRTLFALGGTILLTSVAAAGCAGAGAALFNPAVDGWLEGLATSIGAQLVADGMEKGLSGIFKAWTEPVINTINYFASRDGYNARYDLLAPHPEPPTVLGGVTRTVGTTDPMTDRLIACVNGGKSSVVFEAWAWQGLSMYINDLTSGKSGADLARLRELCVLSLVPSGARPNVGTSPDQTVGWMTYQSRNGSVEIAYVSEPGGTRSAIVTAQGIPNAQGGPTSTKFTLPSQAGAS